MDSFIPEKTETEVRRYFENAVEKDILRRPKENIAEIERRYAPLGIFEIHRTKKIKVGTISKLEKTIEEENKFYVNLNNLELHYVSSKRIFRKERSILSSDLIEKVIDLPTPCIKFLSDIINKGIVSHHELNKKHFLFLNGNFDYILILRIRDLIEFSPSTVFTIQRKVVNLEYRSKVNIPEFNDRRYDLKKFLVTKRIKSRKYKRDGIEYNVEKILETLETIFDGNGEFKEKIYMPYDRCKYTDRNNRFRYKRLIMLKFNN
ncbi:MAG TPA: hypothetical protein EYP86_03715 [Candidatus Altiarchaeales archaeon]|nr:hypothetical protein [Candidatus Altiarchaeales archaeon]